ncbi:MAG TPA: NupC/NupG family nucleoside CNT transporter [Woeseiaceae bacterium]|nr:NupC/NupG family nucleoside CNT transporter [Woeseiaceae bacterium]
MRTLISLGGILLLLLFAWLLSSDRRAIRPRTVLAAFAIQLGMAVVIMYLPAGRRALDAAVRGVGHVIGYANAGIEFVFGNRIGDSLGFTIAFNVLPIIVFFAAIMSVLYYLGIMQWIVAVLGGALRKLLGTTQPESMSAVSNIFVGHTEAPLVVRPYLARMSESELFAVMTGGCATIAGTVMAAYAQMGVDLGYLITASFMAAPGGLLVAKIMVPETGSPAPFDPADLGGETRPVNLFEALGNGAATGLTLALNVGAMLLAFVATIALVNGVLGMLGEWAGYPGLSLQLMLGWLFAPVAFMIGVPWEEAVQAGTLIGEKFVINEFYAYVHFVEMQAEFGERTRAIITFALCGFANLTSIAILLGGLGSIVPSRRSDIARLGLRAVIGGTLVNLVNATIAGILVSL